MNTLKFCIALACLFFHALGFTQTEASCLESESRRHELISIDEGFIEDSTSTWGSATVPTFMHQLVERIHRVSKISPDIQIKVSAYKHPKINAHASDHGALLFTEGTWSLENGLSQEEIAAIVAHEIAHMEMSHSLDWACGALTQLGNPELTLQQAVDELGMELFNSNSTLAKEVRKRFHLREMLADNRAVSLLAAAGFDTTAVARVLLKLHQLNPNPGSTLSAGTHPDLVVRAQAAAVAQAQVLQANIQ